ncbi:type 1 glutamine amidotransferase [Roseateles sp. UC29_93]|uniref:type 1 glutamine amidotransferase n=1 Tax=Roseateles sp. UC29_93 TaxID=3350177 RepID=UPI00367221EE
MRPVLILQHEPAQGPGYLLQCLRAHDVPVHLLRPDLGDTLPRTAGAFSGLVLLGSDHGVNDGTPWIRAEQALLIDALRHSRPILGHCFGAQQLARAMGAGVARNPRPDIGWRELWITPAARADCSAARIACSASTGTTTASRSRRARHGRCSARTV